MLKTMLPKTHPCLPPTFTMMADSSFGSSTLLQVTSCFRGVRQPLCFCCAFCLGERFIRGRVAHNREGSSSPIRGVASRSKVQFCSSVDEGFRRAQPWTCGTPSTSQARIQGDREVLCSAATCCRTQPRRTCCRGSCTCGSFGGRFTGAGRGESRSSVDQGSTVEGSRGASRAACGRTIGFHSEIHSEVSHQDREDSGRPHSRTSSVAASHGEFRTVVRRSCFQRAAAKCGVRQAPTDVEEEVRRLRAQVAELQHERAAKQEVEESKAKKARMLSTSTLDLTPIHSGAAGSRNASDMMQNLIHAADSTSKEVRSA